MSIVSLSFLICCIRGTSGSQCSHSPLVCPPLGHGLQLGVPHQLPHVAGLGLGRVDPPSLLALGHLPPQLVVFVQHGLLGLAAQLPEDCLGLAVGGRTLRVQINLSSVRRRKEKARL